MLVARESVPVLLTRRDRRARRAARASRTSDHWRRTVSVLLVAVAVTATGVAVQQTADAAQLQAQARGQHGGQALALTLPGVEGVVMGVDHVTLPSTVLEELVPGDVRTFTVRVSNEADASVLVTSAFAWAPLPSDQRFVEDPAVRIDGLPPLLDPGASAEATVTVHAPQDWNPANRGRTGRLVVRFVGTQA